MAKNGLRMDIPFKKMNKREKGFAKAAFNMEMKHRDFAGEIIDAKSEKKVFDLIGRTSDLREILRPKTQKKVKLPTRKDLQIRQEKARKAIKRTTREKPGDLLTQKHISPFTKQEIGSGFRIL